MTKLAEIKHMGRAQERALERLSPFELKDKLIKIAQERAQMAGASQMLNAGRGNPNWIATTPREAFFLLGQFALTESRRVWHDKDLGGMPAKDGIAHRLDAWLAKHGDNDGENPTDLLEHLTPPIVAIQAVATRERDPRGPSILPQKRDLSAGSGARR